MLTYDSYYAIMLLMSPCEKLDVIDKTASCRGITKTQIEACCRRDYNKIVMSISERAKVSCRKSSREGGLMKTCNKCGAANQDHSKFCLRCGSGLQEKAASVQNNPEHESQDPKKGSNQCPKCQEPFETGELFCANCGFKLSQPEATSETEAHSAKETEKDVEAAPVIPADSKPGTEEQPAQNDSLPETESDSEVVSAKEDTAQPARLNCPRCGQAVVKDAAFCRSCGYNLKKAAEAAQTGTSAFAAGAAGAAAYNHSIPESAQPGPSVGSSPMSSPGPYPAPPPPHSSQPFGGYQQSGVQATAAYQPPGYQPPPQPAKPKKRKGLAALVIILVIVLAGGVIYLFAGQTIRRMIMGNKAAYLAIEGQQLKQNAEDLSEWMADMGNKNERPAAGGHRMAINIDLPDYGTGMDPVLQSALENITWHTRIMYDSVSVPSRYYAGIDLQTGSEPLLSIEGYYDEDQLILGVPGLLSRYLWIQRDMVDEYGGDLGFDTSEADEALRALDVYMNLDLGINEARLAGSMYQIIDIVLEHIDDVEYSANEELVVGPVRQSYNRYTMTLGHESARLMMIELLTFIRDDPEIYNLISGMANLSMASDPYYAEMGITFSLEEFQSEIDWMLEDLEDAADEEPFTIINDIYVDGDDQIFGRYFRIVPESGPALFEYKNYRPRSGNQSAVEITVVTEDEDMQYQNIYEHSGERKTGEIIVLQNNQVLMSADYSDYEKVTIGSRDYFLGDFRFMIYENNTEITTIEYKAVQNGNEVQMQFGVPEFGHITMDYEEIAEQDLVFPSFTGDQLVSITDYEALDSLMTQDVMMELFRIMQQLGLNPEDF